MFTIRKKLYSAFAAVLLVMLGLGSYMGFSGYQISEQLRLLAYFGLPGATAVNKINTMESDYRLAQYSFITGLTQERMALMQKKMDENAKKIETMMTDYEKTIDTDQDRQLFEKMKADWLAYLKSSEHAIALGRSLDTKTEARLFLENETRTAFEQASLSVDALVEFNIAQGKRVSDKGEGIYQQALVFLGIFGLIGIVFSVGVAFWLGRNISNSVSSVLETSKKIAGGDLRSAVHVESNDEMGLLAKSFNEMIGQVKNLIGSIQNTAEQVAASSEELTASADQSAQATQQIAQNIGDVSESSNNQIKTVGKTTQVVEGISGNVDSVAKNAQTAATQAENAAARANEGMMSIEKAIRQMTTIETAVSDSTRVVTALGERSQEIGQIVETISGIAGQTNLLALNAAIEAARAGDMGKGFAVVAEEVRKLAEQSQVAAEKIAELIGGIQAETEQAVTAMNHGNQEVKTGTAVVQEAGAAFVEISGMATEVFQQIRDISDTMQSVSAGTAEIVNSVNDIDNMSKVVSGEAQNVAAATEEQSASMEQIAASSKSLSVLAEQLQTAANKFRV